MTAIPPYPLQWPDDIRRSQRRERSRFQTTLSKAMANVSDSLRRFGDDSGRKITGVVITSNASLGDMRPADPGIAVWFHWDDGQRRIAADKYDRPECNLQAIHHILEARRTELRHAGIEIARATFRGFQSALPAPASEHWTTILALPRTATADDVKAAHRAKIRACPDEPSRLPYNVARDQAIDEITGRTAAT